MCGISWLNLVHRVVRRQRLLLCVWDWLHMNENVNDVRSSASNQGLISWHSSRLEHSPLVGSGMERNFMELDIRTAPTTASQVSPLLKIQDIHDARERLFLAVQGA